MNCITKPKKAKDITSSVSDNYEVSFNGTLIRDGVSDLKEAINFAYSLHLSTLSTRHYIIVDKNVTPEDESRLRSEQHKDKMPVAIFNTVTYFYKDGDK